MRLHCDNKVASTLHTIQFNMIEPNMLKWIYLYQRKVGSIVYHNSLDKLGSGHIYAPT
ncbi:hypothetical protein DVH24_042593 [Malus domestica]|uniref:Uncharacterized protein n=1 Tax=Malus domestica TaxID=3750 RepID=A0A498JAH9_MALDO|nr:hypothetical protein DVH24_042593 [Malus domestica]